MTHDKSTQSRPDRFYYCVVVVVPFIRRRCRRRRRLFTQTFWKLWKPLRRMNLHRVGDLGLLHTHRARSVRAKTGNFCTIWRPATISDISSRALLKWQKRRKLLQDFIARESCEAIFPLMLWRGKFFSRGNLRSRLETGMLWSWRERKLIFRRRQQSRTCSSIMLSTGRRLRKTLCSAICYPKPANRCHYLPSNGCRNSSI